MAKAFTPRTRAVLLNSPNNPSGVVFDEDFVRGHGAPVRGAGHRTC